MKLKIIKGYGPECEKKYFGSGRDGSDWFGVEFDGGKYLINRKDFNLPDMPERENILGMPIPRMIYKIVDYSIYTKEAIAERIFDGKLIKKIIEKFYGTLDYC